jgi:phospholipid-transporting ATPase
MSELLSDLYSVDVLSSWQAYAVIDRYCPANIFFPLQASSPDEEALVQAAAYLGIGLLSRSTDKVEVEVHGRVLVFEILAVLEFNSDRKRMSIIAYSPHDNKIRIFCKGADSIIMARIQKSDPARATVQAHLDEMAQAGYRTLCISERELTPQEYEVCRST